MDSGIFTQKIKCLRKVDYMNVWITQVVGHYGYLAISLFMAIESVFPVFPSEIILTFGGYMTTYSSMNNIWLVILLATSSGLVGAITWYWIGRLFSSEKIEGWMDGKLGRILHMSSKDVIKAKGWFDKRGKTTVFFCRFLPVIRTLISIPAGMTKMNFGIFMLLSASASLLWNTLLVFLGEFAGKSYQAVAESFGVYSKIALIIIAIVCIVLAVIFIKKRRKKEKETED